jgi:protein TonB
MKRNRAPGLDELAFEGRNKEYGAYYLRRKYPVFVLISMASGIFITCIVVLIPWLRMLFEPVLLSEGTPLYQVEYYAMELPPEEETMHLAQAPSRLEETPQQAPVVIDSAVVENERKRDEEPEKTEAEVPVDSIEKKGGSGLGNAEGNDSELLMGVDVRPGFPGGDEARLYFLRKNVRYPEVALRALIQGVVMVVFVVEADGSLSGINVQKPIGGGCDEEAIRVTSAMPRWNPGKRNGKPVRVLVRMPVVFRIPGNPVGKN